MALGIVFWLGCIWLGVENRGKRMEEAFLCGIQSKASNISKLVSRIIEVFDAGK